MMSDHEGLVHESTEAVSKSTRRLAIGSLFLSVFALLGVGLVVFAASGPLRGDTKKIVGFSLPSAESCAIEEKGGKCNGGKCTGKRSCSGSGWCQGDSGCLEAPAEKCSVEEADHYDCGSNDDCTGDRVCNSGKKCDGESHCPASEEQCAVEEDGGKCNADKKCTGLRTCQTSGWCTGESACPE